MVITHTVLSNQPRGTGTLPSSVCGVGAGVMVRSCGMAGEHDHLGQL